MNPLYVQTLRRHRRLFVLIVITAVTSATWMSVGAPKMYRSAVTLWSDAPGAAEQLNGATPPAAHEQSMLNELPDDAYFRDKVADGAALRAYFKSHPVEGWGPTAIVAKLRGGGTVDARIETALTPQRVISVVLGPHVLQITYDAPSPALARKTLQALVREFEAERVALRDEAFSAYQRQLQQASKAVSRARANLRRYVRLHPGSGESRKLEELAAAERAAIQRLTDAGESLQSASNAGFDPAAFEQTLRVIDPPTLPTVPTTGRKRIAMAMFAGLFAGLLVSALGVVALTMGAQLVRGSDAVARRPLREEPRPAAEQQLAEAAAGEQHRLSELRDELASQETRQSDRERQLAVKFRELQAAERERTEASAELTKREAAIAQRERAIERSGADAAAEAAEATARVEAREGVLEIREALREHEAEVVERDGAVAERERELVKARATLTAREEQLEARDAELHAKSTQLAAEREQLHRELAAEQDRLARERSSAGEAVGEANARSEELAAQERELNAKQAAVTARESAFAARESELARREGVLERAQEELQSAAHLEEEEARRLDELRIVLAAREAEISSAEAMMASEHERVEAPGSGSARARTRSPTASGSSTSVRPRSRPAGHASRRTSTCAR